MFIATANGTIEHVDRPSPLRDAEPTCTAPQHPSVLEGTNALRGFGYTIDIARVRPGNARLFAATATIVVPRWQMLEQLSALEEEHQEGGDSACVDHVRRGF